MPANDSRVVIATRPAFLNRSRAGKYLGRSDEWLRLADMRHDLNH